MKRIIGVHVERETIVERDEKGWIRAVLLKKRDGNCTPEEIAEYDRKCWVIGLLIVYCWPVIVLAAIAFLVILWLK